jgi:hypothetical protein
LNGGPKEEGESERRAVSAIRSDGSVPTTGIQTTLPDISCEYGRLFPSSPRRHDWNPGQHELAYLVGGEGQRRWDGGRDTVSKGVYMCMLTRALTKNIPHILQGRFI